MIIKDLLEYIVIEFRNGTAGEQKKMKTLSIVYDDLDKILDEVLASSKFLKEDLVPRSFNSRGKPQHLQTTIVLYTRKGSEKTELTKCKTIYGYSYIDLYNKVVEIYS